ncbi:hypothetical protein JXA85_07960 [Candidatus Woesearchaeota archaeon]|nr:hypothetical protein [Candidatus Woesearchaeota archaeon]
MTKQILVQKQKTEQKQELSVKQKVAIASLVKHLQVLEMKEWLLLAGFTIGGALLRVPMQALPSAEPITFFAILGGWLFGKKKGLIAGATAFYISNFFCFGGQGPWSLFQVIGAGAAGLLGGFLRKNASVFEVLLVAFIATLAFEISVNIGSLSFFPYPIFVLFLSALPFMLVHAVSNIIFASGMKPFKRFIEKKGGFDEKEATLEAIKKISPKIHQRITTSWFGKLLHNNG